MKARTWLLLLGTILAAGGAAALLLAAPTPAGASKDACMDALTNLYNICRLAFGINGELLNFAQALHLCETETDPRLKVCWTSCAINDHDCGQAAACIDTCFGGATMCGFLIQLSYVDCNTELPAPSTHAGIPESQAFADCPGDTSGLYDCYKTCAYQNWRPSQCQAMYDCARDCKATGDDDASPDDDSADDDSDATHAGSPPSDKHSSACGA